MKILAVPAIGASLLCVLMGVYVVAIALNPHGHFDQNELKMIRGTAIIVGSAIIIFAACILFTKQLSKKERIKWLLLIVFVPAIGLPMFHQFMGRRLNIRELKEKLKVQRAEAFLKKIEVPRETLTDEQFEVVGQVAERDYAMKHYYLFTALFFAILTGILAPLVIDIVDPRNSFLGETTVIVDHVKQTKRVLEWPPQFTWRMSWVLIMVGVMLAACYVWFVSSIFGFLSRRNQDLIRFLQAGKKSKNKTNNNM